MLSFLNSALLWALPLAAAPALLHLLSLRRARRLPFSDLTLLRAAHRRSLPSTRLRQWLLMLVRTLALVGLVAAFARPVLHGSRAGAGAEQGLDIVLLADTSWSMGARERGRTRFEWAVSAGLELIGMLRPADRVAVGSFSDRLETDLAWARDRAQARQSLVSLRVGARGGDAALALGAAYRFLSASDRSRRRVVLLLSDGAAHLLRSVPGGDAAALPGFDPRTALLCLRWSAGMENAQLSEVRAASSPGQVSLFARASVYGGARDTSLELWLKDRRVGQRALRLERGLSPPIEMRLPSAREPELWGRVELRRDALAADDAYYYSLRVQPRPRVLLLYGNPSVLEAGKGGYFLRQLLGETDRLPYQFEAAELGRLDQVRLEDYGAVVLMDARSLGPRAPALERYVIRGGGLWIIPGAQSEQSYRDLASLLPGRLGALRENRGRAAALAPDAAGPRAEGSAGFSWGDFELQNIAVARRYALEPAAGARVWFRDGAGEPLIVEGSSGSGKVLLWACALDLDWTNLGLKPAFAALADLSLRGLTGYAGGQTWRAVLVGEPIVRTWAPGEPAPARVQVRGPGGRSTILLVRERRVEYRDTGEPGLYFLSSISAEGDARAEAYAVNLDRRGPEGDLAEPSSPPWSALRPEALREDFDRAVYGREIRGGALAFVALLLALEGLLCG